MSYILDALKKSEKERQKKNLPDLLTVQEPVLNEKRKRPLWPYMLIAVLIVNMGFIGYLLGTKKPEKIQVSSTVVQKEEPKPLGPQKPEAAKVEMPATVRSVQEVSQHRKTVKEVKEKETKIAVVSRQKKSLPVKAAQEPKVQEKAIVQPVTPPVKKEEQTVQIQTPSKETGTSAAVPVSNEQKAVHVDTPPEPDKIYNPGELPQSIQQGLPSVNMSIFMYSDDPDSRMVRINGQTYREGQKISEDLTLERIIPNGIILNYKNYRFQVGQQHREMPPLHQ